MKTKTLLAALCSACFSLSASAQSDIVTIQGNLLHFNNKVQIEDMSEFKHLTLPNDERTFIPDQNGHFSISFKLSQPNYFRLGRNILYLSPGDQLITTIDRDNPARAQFSGRGAEANLYLRGTPFPHGGSYLDAGTNLKADVSQTVSFIESAGGERQKQLNKLENVTPQFQKYESARIKADMLNAIIMMKDYFPIMRHMSDSEKPALYAQIAKAIGPFQTKYGQDLVDPEYLKLEVFSMIADNIVYKTNSTLQAGKINDWLHAADIADHIQHLSNKKEIEALLPQIGAIADPAYRKAVMDTYNTLMKFGNGDSAIDFAMYTVDGKPVHLSDFTGKVIFVDLWATWCGPCLEELPHFARLKEKYKNDPNMVFISLSIDDDKSAWKKKLGDIKGNGIQAIIDRAALNDYSVATIPRTIIIDKNFKIAAMKGNLPSDKQTEVLLNNLLIGNK